MKNGITLLMCLALLIVSGCQEGNMKPSLWLMATPDVDSPDAKITGRAGLRMEAIEFGAETNYIGVHGANQNYGVYGLVYFKEYSDVGQPYIGYHATIAVDQEDGGLYGPVGGTILKIGDLETVIEYQYRSLTGDLATLLDDSNEEHQVYAGMIFRF